MKKILILILLIVSSCSDYGLQYKRDRIVDDIITLKKLNEVYQEYNTLADLRGNLIAEVGDLSIMVSPGDPSYSIESVRHHPYMKLCYDLCPPKVIGENGDPDGGLDMKDVIIIHILSE